ncbi:MAG TPA: class I fructose-bisphosphate aldolase, partial [Aggregatilineales bacterium]|nr:class I fructose-bisphosphate aldolase [Aggregatilineales bacterium]
MLKERSKSKSKSKFPKPKLTYTIDKIEEALGDKADYFLNHKSTTIPKEDMYLPSSDFIDNVYTQTDRNPQVLRSLAQMFGHGRLANTGYLSILPVDQGIEHSAGASFAPNPTYFDPASIVELAIEGGCNAVASTFGVLGAVARKYAHRIPFMVKINHNELLTYPNKADQIMFGTIKEAWNMGAVAVGATIYFGSPESGRQLVEVSQAFAYAHELGMATVLWCYMRNSSFKVGSVNHENSTDLSSQANHLGATIQADILKQKLPTSNGGFKALNTGGSSYGKLDERIYTQLTSDHPIDLTRYQVANGYM